MQSHLPFAIVAASLAAACCAQTPQWTETRPTKKPVARQNHAMAYDSARMRTVMFGAWDGTSRRNDTWEWNGTTWTEITTGTTPSPRDGMAMAYDSKRRVTVLTAGYVQGGQTWEYDGTNWTDKTPATSHSLGPHNPLVYDSARGVCVLFGVQSGVPQTWEWNGVAWTRKTTALTPGGGGSMAYDSLRRRTILVSGSQTWEYDGTNWRQRLNLATTPPSRGCAAGMVYDSARQVVVMFGGCGSAGGDTWEYDGVDWRRIQTTRAPTNPRSYLAMAYDSDRRRTVLFGGSDASSGSPVLRDDTWEYAGRPCLMQADTQDISLANGGTQVLSLDAGPTRGVHLFWIFGSITGTTPGLSLNGVDFPLNPDVYTTLAMTAVNSSVYVNFMGVLDGRGRATARFVVPAGAAQVKFNLHHAALVHLGAWHCASNPVVVRIR